MNAKESDENIRVLSDEELKKVAGGNSGFVTSSNGMFQITDSGGKSKTVDLGTLMMMLQLDGAHSIDQRIAEKINEFHRLGNASGSESQRLTIELQQLLDKRGASLQDIAKVMDTSNKTYTSILYNL